MGIKWHRFPDEKPDDKQPVVFEGHNGFHVGLYSESGYFLEEVKHGVYNVHIKAYRWIGLEGQI